MSLSSNNYPSFSVIVVVLNMAHMVGACLSSLMSLNYPKNKYEVIVVDGGSTDNTVNVCKDFNAKIIVEPRKGRGIARNVGIANSHGDIIAFIDADCIAQKDWLLVHAHNHQERSTGAVGGSVINPYICQSRSPSILTHFNNFAEFDENLPKRIMYHIPTCNASYKREVLSKANCFDEKLDMYEDFMLSKSIATLGYKIVFDPKAKIIHFGVPPTVTINDYLSEEGKLGAAHFKAQLSYKYIFPRLPMNKTMILVYSPLMILSRTVRELYKLLRVRRCASDITTLPLLVMGSAMWSLSYAQTARTVAA